MNIKKFLVAALLVPVMAFAWQPDPQKPITVLVPNSPGAGNELAFRTLASIIAKTNPGPKFVIINQPGADGVVALNHLMTLPNDGYNIIAPSYGGMYLTNDLWEKNVKKFNWDSFPFTLSIGKSPLVLVASTKSDINTPEEFIRLIRTATSPINVAIGGGAHRTVFEFLMVNGNGNADQVKTTKFQGPLPAVTSVAQYDGKMGTEFGIMPITIAQPLIQAGKVKPIGFSGTQKMPQYPNVPLLKVNNQLIDITAAWTITMPPNTPRDVIDWYVKSFAAASRTKEYRDWCYENVVYINENEQTPAGVRRDVVKMREAFLPILEKIDLSKDQ
jgi:tripartite-type tricarboxylate transporter receptor subunit TctC